MRRRFPPSEPIDAAPHVRLASGRLDYVFVGSSRVRAALEQMKGVLDNVKPFTVIEKRKSEFTFNFIEEHKAQLESQYGVEIMFYMNFSEGPEMLISRSHTAIANYLHILRGDSHPTRESKQKAFGALFGYSDEDIAFWVNDSEGWKGCECECSKCGGPITKEERNDMEA